MKEKTKLFSSTRKTFFLLRLGACSAQTRPQPFPEVQVTTHRSVYMVFLSYLPNVDIDPRNTIMLNGHSPSTFREPLWQET